MSEKVISKSVTISCPQEVVWKYITKVENWKKWYIEGLTDVTPGWKIGAILTFDSGQKPTITQCEPPSLLHLNSGTFLKLSEMNFSSTMIEYGTTVEGMLAEDPLLLADFQQGFLDEVGNMLEKLKDSLEGENSKGNESVSANDGDISGTIQESNQPVEPQQWRIESVNDATVVFNCPTCQDHYEFDAGTFAINPVEKIEGLSTTDQIVSRNFGQKLVTGIVGMVAYYLAHQWINGEGTPLNHGIIFPVIIACVVYAMALPIFAAGFLTLDKMPVYRYKCPNCLSEVFLASNGKKQALPVYPSESGNEPEEHPVAQQEKHPADQPEKKLQKISLEEVDRRRHAGESLQNIDLSGMDLRHLHLPNVDFSGSNLSNANLWGMNLKGVIFKNANLRGANLEKSFLGNTDLTGADLTGASIYDSNIYGAPLNGATMPDGTPYDQNTNLSHFMATRVVK